MKRCIIFYLFLMLMTQAQAQDIDDLFDMPIEELLNVKVITATKTEETLFQTPASVIVVTAQQIRQRRYRTLIDLLDDLPSFDLQRRNNDSHYNSFAIRGQINARKLLILQNGIQIDSAHRENLPIADNFPLYNVKQVEVVYGPASALYGADALGGVINIITERGDNLNNFQINSSIGSDGYRHNQLYGGASLNDDFSFTIGGHWHDNEGADLSEYYPETDPFVDAVALDGSVLVPAAQREPFSAEHSSHSFHTQFDFRDNFKLGMNRSTFVYLSNTGSRPDAALNNREAVFEHVVQTVYGKLRLPLSETLESYTSVNYSQHEMLPSTHYRNVFTRFERGYKYSKGTRRGIMQQLNWQWHERHNMIAGVSYERFYALPETADLPSPYDRSRPVDQQDLFYPNTTLPIQILDVEYHNRAAFLQWQANWHEKIITTLGLRYDDNSRYSSALTPRLGLVYLPTPKQSIKLLYGEAFRAPSPTDNLSTFGEFSGQQDAEGRFISNFFAIPNFNLEPEEANTWELGYNRHWAQWQLSANAYYTEAKNLITIGLPAEPEQFIPGAVILSSIQNQNSGSANYYGSEWLLNHQRQLGGGWHLDVWGNYSWTDGYIDQLDDGQEVDLQYVSKHKIKLGSTLRYQNYFATTRLHWRDRISTPRIAPDDESRRVQVGSHWKMDLHLGAENVFSNFSLYFDVLNLLDQRYYHSSGSSTSTDYFFGMPQEPRQFILTVQYQFD